MSTEQDTKNNKIELKYHSGYWDGPLSGVCLYQGERLWFNSVHDYYSKTEEDKYLDMRIYALHRLTVEEWKQEDYWHNLFKKHVGVHTSYKDGKRTYGQVRSSKTHSLFYDASKKAREDETRKAKDLNDKNIVGYFDRSEMMFRKTKYRDYWLEGESPHSIHAGQPICSNYELIEWRDDAQKWDHFDSDFDGKSSGWSICIQPDGPDDKNKPFWMIVNNCPWCGKDLKIT